MWKYIVLTACLIHYSIQRSTRDDTSYVAAVLEYQVSADVELNVRNYLQHIAEAAEQNADVIIFPELTLTSGTRAVSVPTEGLLKQFPIPALRSDLYDELLVNISSAARQHEVYVLVNIQEEMDCRSAAAAGENCPEEKLYLFNTNVVFDRTGAVIDRYRKINLFGEFTRTPALQPDLGIFTTDFGVTFGHFICFDLMFQIPAIQVVEKNNLTDIIFSTMWFSEMPYLTAVQIQEAYAYAMNVNFLSSGANNVGVGSAGSGIYSGKAGALVSTMPGVPTTRLLVSRVPKIPSQVDFPVPGPIYDDPKDHDSLVLISDPSLPAHISRVLVPGFQEFTLVDKDVSCKFTVRMNQRTGETTHYYRAFVLDGFNIYSRRKIGVAACAVVACKDSEPKSCVYNYRAAAFDGVRSFSGLGTGGNRICSVLACVGDDISSCGERFTTYEANTTAVFEELTIEATVPTPFIEAETGAHDSFYFPVALNVNIMPLEPSHSTYTIMELGATTTYTLSLADFDAELYSFAVWGRKFDRDGQEADGGLEETNSVGDSSVVHIVSPCLVLAFVLLIFYTY